MRFPRLLGVACVVITVGCLAVAWGASGESGVPPGKPASAASGDGIHVTPARSEPLPAPLAGNPVPLILDDGSYEWQVGGFDPTSRSFAWMNCFSVDAANFPLTLKRVSTVFDPGAGVSVGHLLQLLVVSTPVANDPSIGQIVRFEEVQVKNISGTVWNDYDLAGGGAIVQDPGDVCIGFIIENGGEAYACEDTTAPQGRSWVGFWTDPDPRPGAIAPPWPPTDSLLTVDTRQAAGNFMIRGEAETGGQAGVTLDQVDTAQYPAIQSRVTVTDENNSPVDGLGAGSFTLTEDSVPKTITGVTPLGAAAPVSVAVVVDGSHRIGYLGFAEEMSAVGRFVDRLEGEPQVSLRVLSGETRRTRDFTSDKAALREAAGSAEYPAAAASAIYDALWESVTDLAGRPGDRHVVLVTDGQNTGGVRGKDETLRYAAELGVRVHAIAVGLADRVLLQDVAGRTGGRYADATRPGDLEPALADLLLANGRYVVSFSTAKPAGSQATIQVCATVGAATPCSANVGVTYPATAHASMSLNTVPGAPDGEVTLNLTLSTGGDTVSAVESQFQYDSTKLQYLSVVAGTAASAAGKSVDPVVSNGVLVSVQVSGTGASADTAIGNGVVCQIRFRIDAGVAPGTNLAVQQTHCEYTIPPSIRLDGVSCGAGSVDVSPLPVRPAEGSVGTRLTITRNGFGTRKGAVKVGTGVCKVSSWTDTSISCQLMTPLRAGSYGVSVKPPKLALISFPAAFAVKAPVLTSPPAVARPGGTLSLGGNFFGSRKGKVSISGGGKTLNCPCSAWTMSADTGQSSATCTIPKTAKAGAYTLVLKSKAGDTSNPPVDLVVY